MRDKILTILMDNKGAFVSGEAISRQLGVTRAAVWKYIKSFQEDGCLIESIPKKGYRLLNVPDILDGVVIRHGMQTQILGNQVEVHRCIDSTNTRAKELALEGAPEGFLIIAEEQTIGKGRLGRHWVSPPGVGIWMSLVLRPKLYPSDAPKITLIAALSMVEAINSVTGLKAGIKWPNDILIRGRKVCGILTEIHADPDIIDYVVLGIGINVNTKQSDFPEALRDAATSLYIEKGHKITRNDMIRAVIERIEVNYTKYLDSRDFDSVLSELRRHSVTLGRQVKVIGRTEALEGVALDYAEDGALLIQTENGQIQKVLSGDVSIR